MKPTRLTAIVSILVTTMSFAQAPAGAPTGSTGACKDGSFTSQATKKGACSGHKGVKEWYADETPGAVTTGTTSTPTVAGAAASTIRNTVTDDTNGRAPVAGGGAGQVWVDSRTKVYTCPGAKLYGTTKAGSYLTEAAARAAGYRPEQGKSCS